MEQARVFSNSRLLPTIEESPFVRRVLLGRARRRPQVMHYRFANRSELFVRAAFRTADAAHGISADELFIDEFQDISDGDLPVLQETLSHSKLGQIIITGTPKLIDNHLESVFRQSTACEWQVPCQTCSKNLVWTSRYSDPTGWSVLTAGNPSTHAKVTGCHAIPARVGELVSGSIIS